MKKILIVLVLFVCVTGVKAQLWGNNLVNDTIFTADITGADTVFVKKLRAPEGAYIWYEFTSFANATTAKVAAGEGDGSKFQPFSTQMVFTLDSTHVGYDLNGDTIKMQGVRGTNIVGQYWHTLLWKGDSTADTLIIHYSK